MVSSASSLSIRQSIYCKKKKETVNNDPEDVIANHGLLDEVEIEFECTIKYYKEKLLDLNKWNNYANICDGNLA